MSIIHLNRQDENPGQRATRGREVGVGEEGALVEGLRSEVISV